MTCPHSEFRPSRAGEQRHRRRQEQPCQQCLDEYNEWRRGYMAEYRKRMAHKESESRRDPRLWKRVGHLLPHYCAKCKRKKHLHLDHIRPLSQGGTDAITNLQVLCAKCNLKKGTDTADYRDEEYRERMRMLRWLHQRPKR